MYQQTQRVNETNKDIDNETNKDIDNKDRFIPSNIKTIYRAVLKPNNIRMMGAVVQPEPMRANRIRLWVSGHGFIMLQPKGEKLFEHWAADPDYCDERGCLDLTRSYWK